MNILLLLLLLSYSTTCIFGASTVTLNGRQIRVNGEPFFGRGVAYGITPIGQWQDSKNGVGSWDWYSSRDVYMRDLPLLQELNVNLIRTYRWRNGVSHNAFLDECYKRGIYVIVGFPWRWDDFNGGSAGRQRMRDSLTTMVRNCHDHPAVFGWAIGNELNLNRPYNAQVWNFVRELRDLVHQVESPNWHPASSPVADGSTMMQIITSHSNSVDIWMLQVYRGQTFGNLWNSYSSASTKPMMITEYGVDSYCGSNPSNGEQLQSIWDLNLWKDIEAHKSVVSGSLLFAYADGWFKCSEGSRFEHETCPGRNNGFPCTDVNEEYFGIVALVPGPVAPDGGDKIRIKPAFCTMKNAWKDYPRTASWTPTNLSKCSGTSTNIPLAPLYAEADSYVEGGRNAGTNFGNSPLLILKYATDPSFHREVYLRFDLSDISVAYDKAELVLNVEGIDQNVELSFHVGTVSTSWTEGDIEFSNKPSSTYLLTTKRNVGASSVSVDITALVKQTGKNQLSLRLYKDASIAQNTKLQFHSAEGPLGKSFSPRIVLSSTDSQSQEIPDIPYMEDPNQTFEILPEEDQTNVAKTWKPVEYLVCIGLLVSCFI